jgi:hypothetical protein
MKVGMMQPLCMPWQGFFELIYQSERFIFLDDYQFVIQSHHQRNLLFSNPGKTDWYTIPVQKSISFKMPFNQVSILERIPWRVKMWKRIQQNYSKAPYYPEIAPLIDTGALQEGYLGRPGLPGRLHRLINFGQRSGSYLSGWFGHRGL